MTEDKAYKELQDKYNEEEERALVCVRRMGYFSLIIAKKRDFDGTNYALELLYNKRDSTTKMNHVRLVKAIDEQIDKVEAVIDGWG
jgi:hypothetical protein